MPNSPSSPFHGHGRGLIFEPHGHEAETEHHSSLEALTEQAMGLRERLHDLIARPRAIEERLHGLAGHEAEDMGLRHIDGLLHGDGVAERHEQLSEIVEPMVDRLEPSAFTPHAAEEEEGASAEASEHAEDATPEEGDHDPRGLGGDAPPIGDVPHVEDHDAHAEQEGDATPEGGDDGGALTIHEVVHVVEEHVVHAAEGDATPEEGDHDPRELGGDAPPLPIGGVPHVEEHDAHPEQGDAARDEGKHDPRSLGGDAPVLEYVTNLMEALAHHVLEVEHEEAALEAEEEAAEREAAIREAHEDVARRAHLGGEPTGLHVRSKAHVAHEKKLAGRVKRRMGLPLTAQQRTKLEERIHADLSRIRLFIGKGAEHATSGMQAEAFAVGESVVLSEEAAAEVARGDLDTLAHELEHVAQYQRGETFDESPIAAEAREKLAEEVEGRVGPSFASAALRQIEHMGVLETDTLPKDFELLTPVELIQPLEHGAPKPDQKPSRGSGASGVASPPEDMPEKQDEDPEETGENIIHQLMWHYGIRPQVGEEEFLDELTERVKDLMDEELLAEHERGNVEAPF